MSLGSFLSAVVSSVVTPLAPQTGPAVVATVNTVLSGDLGGVGNALHTVINAAGADTTASTILHGVAQAVTNLDTTGISHLLEPVATGLLSHVTTPLAETLATPLTLLAPQFGPAATNLLNAVGTGNIATIGDALHGAVNTLGTDITQSTILHGVANVVTALTTSTTNSFHFASASAGGTDALSGILSGVTATSAHANDLSNTVASATHIDMSHVDMPIAAHDPLADLAHAAHHA